MQGTMTNSSDLVTISLGPSSDGSIDNSTKMMTNTSAADYNKSNRTYLSEANMSLAVRMVSLCFVVVISSLGAMWNMSALRSLLIKGHLWKMFLSVTNLLCGSLVHCVVTTPLFCLITLLHLQEETTGILCNVMLISHRTVVAIFLITFVLIAVERMRLVQAMFGPKPNHGPSRIVVKLSWVSCFIPIAFCVYEGSLSVGQYSSMEHQLCTENFTGNDDLYSRGIDYALPFFSLLTMTMLIVVNGVL